MGLSQILMVVVMLLGMAGYYWWTVGRKGGVAGWQKEKLGLRDAEVLVSQWTAAFDYDESTGEKVMNFAMGVQTRGKTLYVGLTNLGCLVIGHMEDSARPMSFERGQVLVSHFSDKAKVGTMAGMQGMEKAHVVALTPVNQSQFRLQIAASAVQALQVWANSAA